MQFNGDSQKYIKGRVTIIFELALSATKWMYLHASPRRSSSCSVTKIVCGCVGLYIIELNLISLHLVVRTGGHDATVTGGAARRACVIGESV